MTAVALIMLAIGVLMVESSLTNTSVQEAANAIIAGKPLSFQPTATNAPATQAGGGGAGGGKKFIQMPAGTQNSGVSKL